jgi:hypothetical protein
VAKPGASPGTLAHNIGHRGLMPASHACQRCSAKSTIRERDMPIVPSGGDGNRRNSQSRRRTTAPMRIGVTYRCVRSTVDMREPLDESGIDTSAASLAEDTGLRRRAAANSH